MKSLQKKRGRPSSRAGDYDPITYSLLAASSGSFSKVWWMKGR
jgi:hypothetical protein